MRLLALVSLVAVGAGVTAGCADDKAMPTGVETVAVPLFSSSGTEGKNLRTHLTGDEEVPPNDSRAQGQAIFQVNGDGTAVRYKLIVANIQNVTQAHIHVGPAGGTGGIVAWLYPSAPPLQLIPGRSQGVLGQGVITDADVVGGLAGTGVAGLLAEIRAGNTYVNVHTNQVPAGEIRGQID